MRVAAVQMATGEDRQANLATAARRVAEAASAGARLVVLPETFNLRGPAEVVQPGFEAVDGPTMQWARETARQHGVWLVAGSFPEGRPGQTHCFNTSCLVSPAGGVEAVYRKIHLFDVDVPGAVCRESDGVTPGDSAVVGRMDDIGVGLTVCYDLRFPELYRTLTLAGARMVTVPAAFTERTGRDHWEVLLRARAIENQVFVVAANQIGKCRTKPDSYGRSMIIDPWGVVLAQAPDQECCIVADLDFDSQQRIRTQLPCLDHRRPEAYRVSCASGA